MPFFDRTLSQVMRIHNALYEDEDTVVERGNFYPVETVREEGKDFRRVRIGPFIFITQNLEKPSPATKQMLRAITQGKLLRISWVLDDQGYVGKIETSAEPRAEPRYKVNDFRRHFQNQGLVRNIRYQGRREG